MFNIENLGDDVVFIAKSQDKHLILKTLSERSLFLNVDFYTGVRDFVSLSNNYHAFLKEKYGIPYTLSNKLVTAWFYIDSNKKYKDEKLARLARIKADLLEQEVIAIKVPKLDGKRIYSVNHQTINNLVSESSIEELVIYDKSENPVDVLITKDQIDQTHAVIERVFSLLESGVDIDDIKILNTSESDVYYLDKLCHDANIPLSNRKRRSITNLPYIIKMMRLLKTEGLESCLTYLDRLIEDDNFDKTILQKIIALLNRYPDEMFLTHPDLLEFELERISYREPKYRHVLEIHDMADFIYEENNHYLVLNYTDAHLPKQIIDNDYLTDSEKSQIGMPISRDENTRNKQYLTTLFNGIANLTFFFPQTLDEDMRMSDLELSRKIQKIDYEFKIKTQTYFETYDKYIYAVEKYDLENYYQKASDYDLLRNTYANEYKSYDPQFTGIYPTTLMRLLKKHNSLTGAKIESISLCPFQYFLNYLLKLEEQKPSLNQYLGSLAHKVLEEKIKNAAKSIQKIIKDFAEFPEDINYKQTLFMQAFEKELEELVDTVIKFHKQTRFKTSNAETSFSFESDFDKNIMLSGIIDKTMMKQSEDKYYFVIIDYKLGNKDFDMNKFNQGRQLQLPFYLYCIMKMNADKQMIPVGFYYQTTSLGREKPSDADVKDAFKLKGITLDNIDIVTDLDQDLVYLAGIRKKKDGTFAKSQRLVDSKGFKALFDRTEYFIKRSIETINNGEFYIKPLPTMGAKKDSVSCEYCEMYPVCYSKNKALEVESDE